jgi:hypothetical protein
MRNPQTMIPHTAQGPMRLPCTLLALAVSLTPTVAAATPTPAAPAAAATPLALDAAPVDTGQYVKGCFLAPQCGVEASTTLASLGSGVVTVGHASVSNGELVELVGFGGSYFDAGHLESTTANMAEEHHVETIDRAGLIEGTVASGAPAIIVRLGYSAREDRYGKSAAGQLTITSGRPIRHAWFTVCAPSPAWRCAHPVQTACGRDGCAATLRAGRLTITRAGGTDRYDVAP